jgi:hypothetical protein
MSLRKRWRDLDRETIGRAPDRYGVYELGDEDGTVLELGVGPLKDELKEALSYGRAAKVRWEAATSREHAERLADEHRG